MEQVLIKAAGSTSFSEKQKPSSKARRPRRKLAQPWTTLGSLRAKKLQPCGNRMRERGSNFKDKVYMKVNINVALGKRLHLESGVDLLFNIFSLPFRNVKGG